MYRKFIGTIAVVAITITAFGAAPARADEDDLNRALAALLGIAVVGAIIHKNNKKDDHVVTRQHVKPHVQTKPRAQHRPRRVEPQIQPRPRPHRVKPRAQQRRHTANRHLLPGACFRSYDTRRGTYRGFGRRCMENNYRFVRSLPQHCLIRLKTRDGRRNAYEARCMRDAGYRLARN